MATEYIYIYVIYIYIYIYIIKKIYYKIGKHFRSSHVVSWLWDTVSNLAWLASRNPAFTYICKGVYKRHDRHGCYESVFRFCKWGTLTKDVQSYWGGCRPPRPHRISWQGGLPPSPQTPTPANYERLRPSNSPEEIGKTIEAGLY